MKTLSTIVLLALLPSLSLFAQEVSAPDNLLASAGFHDTDPPADQLIDYVRSDYQSDHPSLTSEPQSWPTRWTSATHTGGFTILRVTHSPTAKVNLTADMPLSIEEETRSVSELDYSILHQVKDSNFLEDGGLKLRVFR